MNRSVSVVSLALAAGLAVAFYVYDGEAQDVSAGGYKIGVVDMKVVVDTYGKRTPEYQTLEKETAEKQAQLDKELEAIEAERAKYQENAQSMGEDERIKLEDAINARYVKYQADLKTAQDSIDRKERRIINDVFKNIRLAIAEISVQENYHLVLQMGEEGPTAVLYASNAMNITQKVIDYLNASKD